MLRYRANDGLLRKHYVFAQLHFAQIVFSEVAQVPLSAIYVKKAPSLGCLKILIVKINCVLLAFNKFSFTVIKTGFFRPETH